MYCVLDKSPEILKDNLYLHKYPRKYFFCLHTGKLRPREHNEYAQGHSATNGNIELWVQAFKTAKSWLFHHIRWNGENNPSPIIKGNSAGKTLTSKGPPKMVKGLLLCSVNPARPSWELGVREARNWVTHVLSLGQLHIYLAWLYTHTHTHTRHHLPLCNPVEWASLDAEFATPSCVCDLIDHQTPPAGPDLELVELILFGCFSVC